MTNKNYVWLLLPIELFNTSGEVRLFQTNCRKLKFGEDMFASSHAYAQRRETSDFLGYVLKTGKNLSYIQYNKLVDKLRRKVEKEIVLGII